MIVTMTNVTRTSVGSTARYSAMPPQTPPTTRLVVLRSRRICDTNTLPSLHELVRRGEHHGRQEGDRHRGLLRERERAVRGHRRPRHQGDRFVEADREERGRLRRHADGREREEHAARDRGGDHRAPADRSGGRILLAGEVAIRAAATLARARSGHRDRLVRRDPEQPVAQRPRAVVPVEGAIRLEEGVVRRLEGGVAVAEYAQGHAVELVLVLGHRLRERHRPRRGGTRAEEGPKRRTNRHSPQIRARTGCYFIARSRTPRAEAGTLSTLSREPAPRSRRTSRSRRPR